MKKEKNIREIVFDTETTGLQYNGDDRIVEIGCVEMINHTPTGKTYHVYINPEREVPEEVVRVHGLTTQFLSDKPKFAEIVDDFLKFIGDANMVAHNATFDINFVNAELRRLNRPEISWDRMVDTLAISRKKNPHLSRHNLDALCAKYGVDNSHRDLHGALLDARLLAEVYIELLGGEEKNGVYEAYYENGKIYQQKYLKKGKIDGVCKTYYETGVLQSERNYVDGERNGIWKYYFSNGFLSEEKTYENEVCVKSYEYWESGKLKSVHLFESDERKDYYYYETGILKSQHKETSDEEQKKDYYETGVLKSEMNRVDVGIRINRIYKDYFSNGVLESEQISENGDLKSYEYWESGKLKSVYLFESDEKKCYYENGNIWYEFGKGFYKKYWENGKIRYNAKYNRHGSIWKYYDKNGKLKYSRTYNRAGKWIREK